MDSFNAFDALFPQTGAGTALMILVMIVVSVSIVALGTGLVAVFFKMGDARTARRYTERVLHDLDMQREQEKAQRRTLREYEAQQKTSRQHAVADEIYDWQRQGL